MAGTGPIGIGEGLGHKMIQPFQGQGGCAWVQVEHKKLAQADLFYGVLSWLDA